MPPGAIEEVGMAVWRYGGFISLTGVLKNLIARTACAVGAQQRSHFSQHHPSISNGEIPHDKRGHIRQRFLPRFEILSFCLLITNKNPEEAQTNQFTQR